MDTITLNRQIKEGTLSGVYVFEGNEEYVKQETLTKIRNSLLTPGFETLNENVLDNPDIDSIMDCAQAVPFMSEKRLVLAIDPAFMYDKKKAKDEPEGEKKSRDEKKESTLSDKLHVLNSQNPSCVLIIYLHSGNDKTKNKAAIQPLKDKIVVFDYLSEKELTDRINAQCRKSKASIKPDAARELILSCGGALNAITLELDKLIAYKADLGDITADDVREVVTPDAETSVFKMIDALIAGRIANAYEILGTMLRNNVSCVMILNLITRQLRLMLYAQSMSRNAYSWPEMMSTLEIKYDSQLRNLLSQARSIKSETLESLYKRAVETEANIKLGKMGERQGLDEVMALLIYQVQKKDRRNF